MRTVEGRRAVLEALRAGRRVRRILIARGAHWDEVLMDIERSASAVGIPVETVARAALDARYTTRAHQGVLAEVEDSEYVDFDALLARAGKSGRPPFLLVLDGVEDPGNLGAVLRSAEGAGVHGVVLAERRAAGVTAAVAKASAGASEHVPVARVGHVADALRRLRDEGFLVVGAAAGARQRYTDVDLHGAVAFVVGAEDRGLRAAVADACNVLVRIPMRGKVESLNASVAAALLLYEKVRQEERAGR